ncbi:MAG: NAD(P)-binding domain-containing protein [Gemmatimonadaceae bacterium]
MKIGILGTGIVGQTIANRLVHLTHDVMLGSRSASNAAASTWAASHRGHAAHGTFAEAATFGDVVFNCTAGAQSIDALYLAEAGTTLRGKILMDISNPLDFSKGMPPTLTVCNTDSVGESIQRAFPDVRVVKTLNTVNCEVMVQPSKVTGPHTMFLCGNDAPAKARVTDYLKTWFRWGDILDLGDITAARGMEMLVIPWVRIMQTLGHANFNWHVQR